MRKVCTASATIREDKAPAFQDATTKTVDDGDVGDGNCPVWGREDGRLGFSVEGGAGFSGPAPCDQAPGTSIAPPHKNNNTKNTGSIKPQKQPRCVVIGLDLLACSLQATQL